MRSLGIVGCGSCHWPQLLHREELVPESKREELGPCEVGFYDYAGNISQFWALVDRHLITIPAGLELLPCICFQIS